MSPSTSNQLSSSSASTVEEFHVSSSLPIIALAGMKLVQACQLQTVAKRALQLSVDSPVVRRFIPRAKK